MKFQNVIKYCEGCGTQLKLNNSRDIGRKRFCGRRCSSSITSRERHKLNPEWSHKFISSGNTLEANKKKSGAGDKNPRWIKDRTKLKNKRFYYEEKIFISEVLKDRDYTCELTGRRGGRLSVHHKNGYADHPDQRFDKHNVVVICRDIHMLFHQIYGKKTCNRNTME